MVPDHTTAFAFLPEQDQALLRDFETYLRNGVERPYRPDTIRTYFGQLSLFFRRCGAAETGGVLHCVTKANVTKVLSGIDHRRASNRRNMLFAVKAFARFLADWGLVESGVVAPILAMKFKSRVAPHRATLEAHDADLLLRHIIETPRYNERTRLLNLALVSVMGFTGLRNSEVCRLKLSDVDFEGGSIFVEAGKGGKDRMVGLPERIAPLLKLYLLHRPAVDVPNFFLGASGNPLNRDLVIKRLARLSRAAGIKVGAHMLRRRFATRTAHLGVPIVKLQRVMGHADIQTTMGYVQTKDHEVVNEMRNW